MAENKLLRSGVGLVCRHERLCRAVHESPAVVTHDKARVIIHQYFTGLTRKAETGYCKRCGVGVFPFVEVCSISGGEVGSVKRFT
jgi:hypothetical protein